MVFFVLIIANLYFHTPQPGLFYFKILFLSRKPSSNQPQVCRHVFCMKPNKSIFTFALNVWYSISIMHKENVFGKKSNKNEESLSNVRQTELLIVENPVGFERRFSSSSLLSSRMYKGFIFFGKYAEMVKRSENFPKFKSSLRITFVSSTVNKVRQLCR